MTPIESPRRLRIASLIEGSTLLVLLGLAVPLKHLAGLPQAVSVMGPIHGLAFVAYLWAVTVTVAEDGWPAREAVWLVLAAMIPFGGFFVARVAKRRTPAVGNA